MGLTQHQPADPHCVVIHLKFEGGKRGLDRCRQPLLLTGRSPRVDQTPASSPVHRIRHRARRTPPPELTRARSPPHGCIQPPPQILEPKPMITTQLTERESLTSLYSDIHKDAHGFRPRGLHLQTWTNQQFRDAIERLTVVCHNNAAAEFTAEQQAARDFEHRIHQIIAIGAKDRETAICWIEEAEETSRGDYLCYKLGLPYGYFNQPVIPRE